MISEFEAEMQRSIMSIIKDLQGDYFFVRV